MCEYQSDKRLKLLRLCSVSGLQLGPALWSCVCCSDARNNALTGSIPPALGELPSIRRVILEHNLLTSMVPACFFASSSLTTLYAHPV
jgi:hypothetical protein